MKNTALERAWDAVPGYREAKDRLARVKALPPITTAETYDLTGVGAARWAAEGSLPRFAVAAAIVNGLDDPKAKIAPADLLRVAAEAERHNASVTAVREGLKAAEGELEARVQAIRETGENAALSHLDTELQELVADITALQPFDQISDAQAAIWSGRTGDFTELQKLLARHTDIRSAQWVIEQGFESGQRTPEDVYGWPEVGVMRGVDKAFPLWAAWRHKGFLIHRRSGQMKVIRPPWASWHPTRDDKGALIEPSDRRDSVAADTATAEFLLWAIANGVHLWVPTADSAVAEYNRLNALMLDLPRRKAITADDPDWEDPETVDVAEVNDPTQHWRENELARNQRAEVVARTAGRRAAAARSADVEEIQREMDQDQLRDKEPA